MKRCNVLVLCGFLFLNVAALAKGPVFYLKNKSDRFLKVDILSQNLTASLFTSPFTVPPQGSLERSDIGAARIGGVKITYCNNAGDCTTWQKEYSEGTFKFDTAEKFYVKFSVDKDNDPILEPQKGNFLGRTEDWSYNLSGNVSKVTLVKNENTKRFQKQNTVERKVSFVPPLQKQPESSRNPIMRPTTESANTHTGKNVSHNITMPADGRITLNLIEKYHNMNSKDRTVTRVKEAEYYKTHIFFWPAPTGRLEEFAMDTLSNADLDILKKSNIIDPFLMAQAQDILKGTEPVSDRIEYILEDTLNTYINGSDKKKEEMLRNYTLEKMFFLAKFCDKGSDNKIATIVKQYLCCCIPLTDYLRKTDIKIESFMETIKGVRIFDMIDLLATKFNLTF